ncbi:hypothetical protein ACOMHN_064319 [Nucella lapillus]
MEIQLPPFTVPGRGVGRQCRGQLFDPPTTTTTTTSTTNNNNNNSSSSSSNNNSPRVKGPHHLIAYAPLHGATNASQIVNRMFLYGCQAQAFSKSARVSKDCDDILEQLSCHVIGAWSPGFHGDCFHRNTGIRIGTGSFAVFVLEVQWASRSPQQTTVAGVGVILYTASRPGLRQSSVLTLGDRYLILPPQFLATDVTSACTASCTRSLLQGDVLVTAAFSRLNTLGQEVTVFRDGQFLEHIFLTNLTSTTSARQFCFQEPLWLKPGDVIHTTCRYTSQNKTRTTFSTKGDVTDSEVCLAYLRFHYPSVPTPPSSSSSSSSPFLSCVSWRSLLPCDSSTEGGVHGERA